MAGIVAPLIEQYIAEYSSQASEVLRELDRTTHTDVLMPQMLSGHVQGRLLSILSRLIRPQNILEIGTFTGYSAICMAEGLQDGGKLITIDINEELENMVQAFIHKAGFSDKIFPIIGNAVSIIPNLEEVFDMVFIDADKAAYGTYFDLVIDKVRKGGVILADNVLWSGKVVADKLDKDTKAINDFNKKISEDPRIDKVILSIRDGITLMIKN